MMRKKLIATNWKMHKTVAEATDFLHDFKRDVEQISNVRIVLAPPFTALPKVSELLGGCQKIRLAAQNMHYEYHGAFTGEISPVMLRELFVHYVILGHSERRLLFKESNTLIQKKVVAALSAELHPILCIGETLEERNTGKINDVVQEQLIQCLKGIQPKQIEDVVIAYEPVWAIGTGQTPTPEQVQEVHQFIRQVLTTLSNKEIADKVPVIYGGSVNSANAKGFLSQSDIDGALIGNAGLESRSLIEIIRIAASLDS